MSGGFFRGTSADQDTRFSNKQAKLMKSQKFPPELEHLVDMSKVKMDVMRPWIANRVTELLGFEDEVLINFIYGLLDGKEVNGKEVQISLTGFMEKNTGKFMKELWSLLLSAQKNASGVPQQFLDSKEEETRKKKAEADRIASEIQKKKEKEGRELEQEKLRKMDAEADISRANHVALDPSSKHQLRSSSAHSADEKETNGRNGSRARSRVSRSPHSADRPSMSPRNRRSRSVSKSFSNSRSYSDEQRTRRSRSISDSPLRRGRSISSERVHRSPPRRSITPRRRYSPRHPISPSRRRSSHSRRRSTSRSRRRSPSPMRRSLRSPLRRRSRSPIRRRSRSPVRRRSRSPVQYRSRSPVRRRSPSPFRRRRRSPSPIWRRSPSPARRRYRRSPSSPRRRSPSPIRRSPIPSRRRSPTPRRHRSPSPEEWSSPSPVRHLPPSPGRRSSPKRGRTSSVQSPRERLRNYEKLSPIRHARSRENVDNSAEIDTRVDSVVRRPPISLRSPQRDPRDRDFTRKRAPSSSPSPQRSLSHSASPPGSRRRSPSDVRRSCSPYETPVKQTKERRTRDFSVSPPEKSRDQKNLYNSPKTSGEERVTKYDRDNGGQKLNYSQKGSTYSSADDEPKDSLEKVHHKDVYSPDRVGGRRSGELRSHLDGLESRKKDQEIRSEKTSRRVLHSDVSDQQLAAIHKGSSLGGKQAEEKNYISPDEFKTSKRIHDTHNTMKSTRKVDDKDKIGSLSSGSEESDKHRSEVHEKKKHKRSKRKEVASDDSYDSEIEDRKDVKRRRKDEKRLRKEERRRRREERRRRREERRAEKLKAKSVGTVTPPSEYDKNHDGSTSDGEHIVKMGSGARDAEGTESEQKRLEIELRKKALESLKAKKGIGH